MIKHGVKIIDLGLSIFSLVRIINDVVALNKKILKFVVADLPCVETVKKCVMNNSMLGKFIVQLNKGNKRIACTRM